MMLRLMLVVALSLTAAGCGRSLRQISLPGIPGTPTLSELWKEPSDIKRRDLFHGAGGAVLVPKGSSFAFVAADTTGFSPGFDVTDAAGLEWSVKTGPEAQSEVTTSRILWAIGFHQPPTYYVERWTLTGAQGGEQPAGRFRPKLKGEEVVGDWSWYENPFVGSRPYAGLVVANLILNSWEEDFEQQGLLGYERHRQGRAAVCRPRCGRLARQDHIPAHPQMGPAARIWTRYAQRSARL